MARVRELLDPILLDAGYSFTARSDPRRDRETFNAWVDYCRGAKVISLAVNFRGRALSLTTVDEQAGVEDIGSLCFTGLGPQGGIDLFIMQFIECVRQSPFYLVESSALTRHAEPPDAMDSR